MNVYLVCCTQVICNEVRRGVTQKDIAVTYAMALRSAAAKADDPDWKTINEAIIEKWNVKALSRIKERAWAIADGRTKP